VQFLCSFLSKNRTSFYCSFNIFGINPTKQFKPIKVIPMKKLIATIALALFAISINAQTPPEPNGGNGAPAGGNTPVGGGAPIGSGIAVLLVLGTGYGLKKVYDSNLKKLND